ncbi:EthD domain-containing protein [Conexibacter sp. CPCC 206217]|uniref:EthD domain-containing protein n=1 Tax=Conexibacter sp. CPCC 206217 TaxID=3064574 RepID=UPI0027218ED8|nr:EthD domain-containing protein [Conexibacter sp. CPCC 206217]MDO8212585.1 EthD domain-containing protein [Conexibacter sp. CPCC 206217]
MLTRFGLAPRRPGMTVAAFQRHWRTHHAQAMRALPELTRYWQNHRLPGAGALLPWPGFDACSEMDAPDRAAFARAFAAPAFDAVRADQPLLCAMDGHGVLTTERIVGEGERGGVERGTGLAAGADSRAGAGAGVGEPAGIVRLLVFLRLAPGAGRAQLAEALADGARGAGTRGREAFLAVEDEPAAFEAVEILWFGGERAAEAYLAGGIDRDAERLAGLVRGSERLLAAPLPVI